MVKLNLHVLYLGLTMVQTLTVLYIYVNNKVELVRRYHSRQVLFCLLRLVCMYRIAQICRPRVVFSIYQVTIFQLFYCYYHSFIATTCITTSQQAPSPLVPSMNQTLQRTWILRNGIKKILIIDCMELRNTMSTPVLTPYRPKKLKLLFNPTFPSFRQSSAF